VIVGAAGHIDHGKTTLVRALTGVDRDRLPEEKKLARAPVFEVAATAGTGLEPLREHLLDAARKQGDLIEDGRAFRLPIDRAFSLDNVGTVVTGTVHAGRS